MEKNTTVVTELQISKAQLKSAVDSGKEQCQKILHLGSRAEVVQAIEERKKYETNLTAFQQQLDSTKEMLSPKLRPNLPTLHDVINDNKAQIEALEKHLGEKFIDPASYDALEKVKISEKGLALLKKQLNVVEEKVNKLDTIKNEVTGSGQIQDALNECRDATEQLKKIDDRAFQMTNSDTKSALADQATELHGEVQKLRRTLEAQRDHLMDKQILEIAADSLDLASQKVDEAQSLSDGLHAREDIEYISTQLKYSINPKAMDSENKTLYRSMNETLNNLENKLDKKFAFNSPPATLDLINSAIEDYQKLLNNASDDTPTRQISQANAIIQQCKTSIKALEHGKAKTDQQQTLARLS